MRIHKYKNWTIKVPNSNLLFIICLFFVHVSLGQSQNKALPNNGSNSKAIGPQGASRYQRGFYLITPKEIRQAGFINNISINSIGFNLGEAQNDTTKGRVRIFLKNTRDTFSRMDTGWTTISNVSASYLKLNNLIPATYEWQLKSNCSDFTTIKQFTTDNLDECLSPTSLKTTNITTQGATFSWVAPNNLVSKYYVEYRVSDGTNTVWVKDSTSSNYYNKTSGLTDSKQYEWRVTIKCSNGISTFASTSFSTLNTDVCSEPVTKPNRLIGDSSVVLSWDTSGTNSKIFEVRYRIAGTTNWRITSVWQKDSLLLKDSGYINPGNQYEWGVAAQCSLGKGSYAAGSNFTTTVTSPHVKYCFAPENLTEDSLADDAVKLNWDDVQGATTYTIRYRPKKTIAWQNAIAGMTLVNDSIITIPNKTGHFQFSFHGGSPFNYVKDSGVYVAWEYSRSSGALSKGFNSFLTTQGNNPIKSVAGVDSIENILSFASVIDSNLSSLPDILKSNEKRLETWFGSNDFKDSVEVLSVYGLGKTLAHVQSKTPIYAVIYNKSNVEHTYDVTLTVKQKSTGLVRYQSTEQLIVPADETQTVFFSNYNPKFKEEDSIIITIPNEPSENVTSNNKKFFIQLVNENILAFEDGTDNISSTGCGSISGGLLLNKHSVIDSSKIIAVQVYLTDEAIGHQMHAVVCDTSKSIIAESDNFTPTEKDIYQYHSFYFSTPPTIKDEEFFIGVAQSASSDNYRPIGIQWEDTLPRPNTYFVAHLDNLNQIDTLIDSAKLGRLMIRAEIQNIVQDCFIEGKAKFCPGASTSLKAGKASFRFANQAIAFSSQFDNELNNNFSINQILGTPDVYPNTKFAPGVWASQKPDNRNEFIELSFPDADSINFVDIYEIDNAGAVDSIFTMNPVTSAYELKWNWSGNNSAQKVARKNHIKLDSMISYPVSQIKITLRSDTSKGGVAGYNTIDAVAIGREEIPADFDTYLWMPGGETSPSINVTTPGTYVLTTTDANGHESKDSVDVSVITLVTPKIFILDTLSYPIPNDTFCFGDSIRLVSDQSGGNLWSTNETSKSITVKNTSSITLSYTDENGCIASSTPFVVTVNALPVPVIDAQNNGKLCPGKSITLTTTQPFNNYKWSTGSSQIAITMFRSGNYNVQVTDNNGCKGTSSSSSIIAVSNPQPVISGVLRFCPDDSTTLSVGSYSSYLWSNGSTSNTSVVKNIGGINVTVTNGDGCEGSASVNVSLFAKPTPSIIGKEKICPGETITIAEGTGNYINYLWTPGNYSTSSIQINQTGTYNVKVTDQNGCKADINRAFSQAPVPTPVVTSNVASTPSTGVNRVFAFCPKTSLTLFAGAGYNSYMWSSYSNNNSVRLGSGSSILTDSSSTYIVAVTNDLGCKGTDTVKTVASGFAPPSPITISGTSLVTCNAVQYTYSIPSISNAEYYIWKVPNGVTILSGQGTTSINVTYGSSFKLGAIQVEAGNRCGISPGRTATSLAVTALSDKPGAITGKTTGICTAITETYSVPVSSRATSYAWTVPTGATIASGQGTRTITLTFNTRFITGTLSVISVNSCGSSEATSLLISGYPQKPGMVSGPSIVCSYQTNLIYSIDPVPGATSYQWFVPSTAGIVSGQGTRSIAMRMGTKEGRVKVITVSSCGKSSDTSNIGVILNTTCIVGAMPPPTNTTSFNGKTIKPIPEVIANTGGSVKTNKLDLEWTLGETIVQTEVSPVMMYTQGFHEPLSYIKIPSREGANLMISDLINIKVYPNPISSVLKLEFGTTENMGTQNLQLEVQDVYGRTVKNKVVQTDNKVQEINMTNVMSGNYFLVIRNENGTLLRTIKLVKTN